MLWRLSTQFWIDWRHSVAGINELGATTRDSLDNEDNLESYYWNLVSCLDLFRNQYVFGFTKTN